MSASAIVTNGRRQRRLHVGNQYDNTGLSVRTDHRGHHRPPGLIRTARQIADLERIDKRRAADMSRLESVGHAEELPDAWHAFERVFALVVELEVRSGEKVRDRARDEDFACSGERCHSLRGVDCDSRDVVTGEVDLPGVQTSAYLQSQRLECVADGEGTANRAGGPVERREDTVASELHGATSVPVKSLLHQRVVGDDELPPTPIAHAGDSGRRVDQVGKQHGGEHPVAPRWRELIGTKLFDRVKDPVGVAREGDEICGCELNEFCSAM